MPSRGAHSEHRMPATRATHAVNTADTGRRMRGGVRAPALGAGCACLRACTNRAGRGAHLRDETHEDSAQLGGARDRGKPLLAQQRGERHGGQLARGRSSHGLLEEGRGEPLAERGQRGPQRLRLGPRLPLRKRGVPPSKEKAGPARHPHSAAASASGGGERCAAGESPLLPGAPCSGGRGGEAEEGERGMHRRLADPAADSCPPRHTSDTAAVYERNELCRGAPPTVSRAECAYARVMARSTRNP